MAKSFDFDALREDGAKRAEEARAKASRSALESAQRLFGAQRTGLSKAFDIVGELQQHTEKAVRKMVRETDWLPDEAKDIVGEWMKVADSGRTELQHTVDRSYGLVDQYFDRAIEEADAEVAAKRPKKKAAAKKKTAKRKPAAKKKK